MLSDALSKLPISEETRGANVVDSMIVIPHLTCAPSQFNLTVRGVIADEWLNSERVLSFIINMLKAKSYIDHNPKIGKDLARKIPSTGICNCMAGFDMLYCEKLIEVSRSRLKFLCLITHSKKFRRKHPFLPWFHPQFLKRTGCTAYVQVLDDDARRKIDYRSPEFKKI